MSKEMVQADSVPADGAEKSPDRFQFGTWYPIETAPKDGTPVLLFWPFITEDGFVISGYWYDPIDVPGRWYSDLVNGGATQPRHWMPLPPPPTEGE